MYILTITTNFQYFWRFMKLLLQFDAKKILKIPFFYLKNSFFQNFAFKKIYHWVIDIHQVSWDTSEPFPALGTQSCLCLCIETLWWENIGANNRHEHQWPHSLAYVFMILHFCNHLIETKLLCFTVANLRKNWMK